MEKPKRKPCSWVITRGDKKGQCCGVMTNNESGMCSKHNSKEIKASPKESKEKEKDEYVSVTETSESDSPSTEIEQIGNTTLSPEEFEKLTGLKVILPVRVLDPDKINIY